MTRLWHSGAELGHEHAEGLTGGGAGFTFDSTIKRTGALSFKFDSNAALLVSEVFTGVLARTYYFVMHFYIPSSPGLPTTGTTGIMRVNGAAAVLQTLVGISSGGKLRLMNAANTQVGSDSAASVTLDTWHRVDLVLQMNGSTNDDLHTLYFNGVQVATSATSSLGAGAPLTMQFGWTGTPTAQRTIYIDDVAVNDDQGTVNNGLIGDQKVFALFPTADVSRAGWVTGNGNSTGLWDGVNNVPPIGVAPGSGTATSQIKDGTTGTLDAYDATMTTYTAAGILDTDGIKAAFTVIEAGSNSTTGTDTVTAQVVSNPAVAGVAGSADIVSGTYPASWNRSQGTMMEVPITPPGITKGTAPVMRVIKDNNNSRANTVCLMAMYVSVSPALIITVPVGTAAGAGLTPTAALSPPVGAASGAGIVPVPTAAAAPPVGAASGAGLSVVAALSAPKGAASGSGLTPIAQANAAIPVGAASGAGITPIAVLSAPVGAASGAGLTPIAQANAAVPVGTASGAGIAPTPATSVAVPVGAAAGAGVTPALAALLNTATASGAGIAPTPSTSVDVPVGAASGAGIAPAPTAAISLSVASASGDGQTPSLALGVATGEASGSGLDPTPRVIILLPVGTAAGLGYDVTMDAGSGDVTIDVPLATAVGAGLAVIPSVSVPLAVATAVGAGLAVTPRVSIPLAVAIAAAAGLTPTPRVSIPLAAATAAGAGLTPKLDLLLAVATASGLGYDPAPIIAVPLGVGQAAGTGFTPRIAIPLDTADALGVGYDITVLTTPQPVDIPVPVATAIGQGYDPVVLVDILVDLATATGEGYAPVGLALLIPTATAVGHGRVFFPLPGLALIGRIRDILTGHAGSGTLIGRSRRTIIGHTQPDDLIGSSRRTLVGRRG